jgi:hypothetical protein
MVDAYATEAFMNSSVPVYASKIIKSSAASSMAEFAEAGNQLRKVALRTMALFMYHNMGSGNRPNLSIVEYSILDNQELEVALQELEQWTCDDMLQRMDEFIFTQANKSRQAGLYCKDQRLFDSLNLVCVV